MLGRGSWIGVLVAIGMALPGVLRAEPLAIIVSAEWEEARAIDLAALRAVYLGRRSRLFGERVRRIDLPPGSPARAGFSLSVLDRSEAELERYWIEQALAGGALPPRQVAAPGDVIAAVRDRVGVLGYLPASHLQGAGASGVRALVVRADGTTTRFGDPGYPIRSVD